MAAPEDLSLTDLERAVSRGDIKTLKTLLAEIDPDRMEYDEQLALFADLANVAAAFQQGESLQTVIQRWERKLDTYTLPALLELYRTNRTDQATLAFARSVYPSWTFSSIVIELSRMDASAETLLGAQRAMEIFRPQDRKDAAAVRDTVAAVLLKRDQVELERQLQEWFGSTRPFAKRPAYVRDYRPTWWTGSGLPREFDEPPVPIDKQEAALVDLSGEEVVKALSQQLTKAGVEFESPSEGQAGLSTIVEATDELSLATVRDSLQTLLRESLQSDIDLYRWVGPVNRRLREDLSGEDPEHPYCRRYGGCRMFLCTHYLPEGLSYWFTGSCQQCHQRIRDPWDAVRRPLNDGGWAGCFHSWDCVRDWAKRLPWSGDEVSDDSKEAPTTGLAHQLALIRSVGHQMMETGIQDRRPDTEDAEAAEQEGQQKEPDLLAPWTEEVEPLGPGVPPKLEATPISTLPS